MVDVECSVFFLEQLIQVKLKLFWRDALYYRSYTISNTNTFTEILVSIFPNIINLPKEYTNSYIFYSLIFFIWYNLFLFYMLAHSLVAILQSMFFITYS